MGLRLDIKTTNLTFIKKTIAIRDKTIRNFKNLFYIILQSSYEYFYVYLFSYKNVTIYYY